MILKNTKLYNAISLIRERGSGMLLKRMKIILWLLTFCFLLTQAQADQIFAQTVPVTDRIAGTDRYKTAVAVSQRGWISSDYAVLARGDNFADALCAVPLAHKYGGPILLTEPRMLSSDTMKEIQRLGVKHLFIAGGLAAVSQDVEDALRTGGIQVIERIYGADRYETSVKIAERIGNSTKVVLATGSDFPDALSISVLAAKWGMPILLTGKDNIPAVTRNYFNNYSVIKTYIVGGTGVISNAVADSVPDPYRLAGRNRFETNAVVLQTFAGVFNFDMIYAATGNDFADALTGTVLAVETSSPLVLVDRQLPLVMEDLFKRMLEIDGRVIALGGEYVVPFTVLERLNEIMQTETMDVAVYYLKDQNNEIYLVREVHAVPKSTGVARAALNELSSGQPITPGAFRVLPPGTEILSIRIENGLATVDFSKEVLDVNVGASGEAMGIASIVNSLTEFPTIQKVQFTVEGSVENGIDWWGHIGLSGQPFQRDLSLVNEPAIWVTMPETKQTITSPVIIRGNARIFEATVSFRLRDAEGNILGQGYTMAEAGAPERGDFEAQMSFTHSAVGKGQIEVYESSMKDGSDQNMVVIPVQW